ncbi:MAG: toll/interleukin-1 receptor domain-containing protein [Verrucomicrobiaceae bacterium]|nr:toll/interleukin-1 receptor domain-containing protein [Verrucomicrobiaceae bacterium]
MPEHQIVKPNLFISHASSDGEFATVLQAEIKKVFADGVNVFCTSSPGAIGASKDWLAAIEDKLSVCQAIIVIVTPLSIERPWLWFEVGASWLRARKDQLAIYPLCAPEIDFSQLPSPLDRLQALSMGKAIDLKLLFDGLIKQFGFGKISSFKAANITKRIPRYQNVKINEADLVERPFYNGRYTGYTDDELCEVIESNLISKEANDIVNFAILHTRRESNYYRGQLVHFREVDKNLDLPPGTAKRLLLQVAAKYGLEPILLKENVVRFQPAAWFREKYMTKS